MIRAAADFTHPDLSLDLKSTQLSSRENEVLGILLAGKGPGEIAEILNCSVKTVSTHLARIRVKKNVWTMNQLIVKALTEQVLDMVTNAESFTHGGVTYVCMPLGKEKIAC